MNIIRQHASNDSIVMFGHMYDKTVRPGFLRVTVIATGFAKEGAPSLSALRAPKKHDLYGQRPVPAQTAGRLPAKDDFMLIPAYIRRKKEGK
ncbi:MAG: cell division protein FtsZ, partial [Elusimicrobiota bacterium]|jgi:cell division GTPase FtsZ|nr:cell division protein FtsZ [Elusimicrobiota bacterium]